MPSQNQPSRSAPPPWAVLLCLLACSLVLMAVHPEAFLCLPDAHIDPWIYTGYALSLPKHWANFPDTYYGTRASFILPAYFAVKHLGVVMGLRVFKLSLFVLNGWSLWALCRRHLGSRVAIITTASTMVCPLLWPQFSWDYPTAIGGMFLMMAFWLIAAGGDRWPVLSTLAAGGCFGLAIHTSLYVVIFFPTLAVFYVVQNLPRLGRIILGLFVLLPVGIALSTALLGLWSMQEGGQFLFFWPNFAWISQNKLSGGVNPWFREGWGWLLHHPTTSLIFAGWLAGLLSLPRSRAAWREAWTETPSRTILALTLAHLTMAATLVAMEIRGEPIFNLEYKFVYLFSFSCWQITILLLRRSATELHASSWPRELAGLFLFYVGGLAFSELLLVLAHYYFFSSLILVGTYLIGALLLLLGAWWAARLAGPQTLSVLTLGLVVVLTQQAFQDTTGYTGVPRTQAEGFFRELVTLHRESYRVSGDARPQFWTQRPPEIGRVNSLFYAVTGSFLWGYSIVSTDFPELKKSPFGPPRWDLFRSDQPLIILGLDPADLQKAQVTLWQLLRLRTRVAVLERRTVVGKPYFFATLEAVDQLNATEGEGYTLIDWKATTWPNDLERNLYGDTHGGIAEWLSFQGPDRSYITGHTSQDHLATPFKSVGPGMAGPGVVIVRLEYPDPAPGDTPANVILQDDNCNTVADLPGKSGGTFRQLHVPLEASVKAFRLVVYATGGEPRLLPRRMSVQVIPSH